VRLWGKWRGNFLSLRRTRIIIEKLLPITDGSDSRYGWREFMRPWAEVSGRSLTVKYQKELNGELRIKINGACYWVHRAVDYQKGKTRLLKFYFSLHAMLRRRIALWE